MNREPYSTTSSARHRRHIEAERPGSGEAPSAARSKYNVDRSHKGTSPACRARTSGSFSNAGRAILAIRGHAIRERAACGGISISEMISPFSRSRFGQERITDLRAPKPAALRRRARLVKAATAIRSPSASICHAGEMPKTRVKLSTRVPDGS